MMAYDNNKVYFTHKSLQSIQFMINEININGGTDLIKHRVNKYFKYGFSIVFPNTDRKWENANYDNNYKQENIYYTGTNENIGPLMFKVRKTINNKIYINHNSNYENVLHQNEEFEKKAMEQGTSLYTSNLFCTFVSILRYVKINNINYMFPQHDQVYDLFDNNKLKLKNGDQELSFLDYQKSIYKTNMWYPIFVKSIILNNYK